MGFSQGRPVSNSDIARKARRTGFVATAAASTSTKAGARSTGDITGAAQARDAPERWAAIAAAAVAIRSIVRSGAAGYK